MTYIAVGVFNESDFSHLLIDNFIKRLEQKILTHSSSLPLHFTQLLTRAEAYFLGRSSRQSMLILLLGAFLSIHIVDVAPAPSRDGISGPALVKKIFEFYVSKNFSTTMEFTPILYPFFMILIDFFSYRVIMPPDSNM